MNFEIYFLKIIFKIRVSGIIFTKIQNIMKNVSNYARCLFYWIITILVGFVNPLFSIVLVVLYYLPKIIQDICQPDNNDQNNFREDSEMKSFSDDIVEDMR